MLVGGPSAEAAVSRVSGAGVAAALREVGAVVEVLEVVGCGVVVVAPLESSPTSTTRYIPRLASQHYRGSSWVFHRMCRTSSVALNYGSNFGFESVPLLTTDGVAFGALPDAT